MLPLLDLTLASPALTVILAGHGSLVGRIGVAPEGARLAEEGLESLVRRLKAPAEAVRRALISPELVTRRSTGRTPA